MIHFKEIGQLAGWIRLLRVPNLRRTINLNSFKPRVKATEYCFPLLWIHYNDHQLSNSQHTKAILQGQSSHTFLFPLSERITIKGAAYHHRLQINHFGMTLPYINSVPTHILKRNSCGKITFIIPTFVLVLATDGSERLHYTVLLVVIM